MHRWGFSDIPSLEGKTALVTGANSGIGFETALALATHGASVILACRDESKGTRACEQILTVTPDATVVLRPLDLADLASVRELAAKVVAEGTGLDILVNNAGVMAIPRRESADGFEMQFGTNHLGHFALTGLLSEALLSRADARVVTVSSTVAQIGRINFDDLMHARRYSKWVAYGQAKLANQLFAIELDRRARAAGEAITSAGAHPGYAATNLQAAGPRMAGASLQARLMGVANSVFAQSAAAGALPSLFGATAPGDHRGRYYGPDRLFGMRGAPKEVAWVRAARDAETARRLWQVSEELTGVRFAL